MTRDETIALFKACEAKRAEALAAGKTDDEAHEAAKAHWNGWANCLIAERKHLEEAERWSTEKPGKDAADRWMMDATVNFTNVIRHRADFSGFIFPGNTQFDVAIFREEIKFCNAQFLADVSFCQTSFQAKALFNDTQFYGQVDFKIAKLTQAKFEGAHFRESVRFSRAEMGEVRFDGAIFTGKAEFYNTTMGTASFYRTVFSGDTSFLDATFSGDASFKGATFSGPARFVSAVFRGEVRFEKSIFKRRSTFRSVAFNKDVWFRDTIFTNDVSFSRAAFIGNALFENVHFGQEASFPLAKFDQFASFEKAHFLGPASFNAIRGERAFTMADATFDEVPDFIQAHFEEAPRLDNVHVTGRMIEPYPPLQTADGKKPSRRERMQWAVRRWRSWPHRAKGGVIRRILHAERDIPARYRALKRLAIQGHDSDREGEFFSGEVRMARFAGDTGDWPLPWIPFRHFFSLKAWMAMWGSVLRFWMGLAYQVFSNIGQSVARPLAWWVAAIMVAAVLYLGAQPGMAEKRADYEARGAWTATAYLLTARDAAHEGRACYVPPEPPKFRIIGRHSRTKGWLLNPLRPNLENNPKIGAISRSVRDQTSAANEAFHLALRNAFIVFDGGEQAAHRTYGCLYGVELYGGGDPVPIVPSMVTYVSAGQKLFSGVMIFLFGLALRNMLKMK
jgi:hypothetical protein